MFESVALRHERSKGHMMCADAAELEVARARSLKFKAYEMPCSISMQRDLIPFWIRGVVAAANGDEVEKMEPFLARLEAQWEEAKAANDDGWGGTDWGIWGSWPQKQGQWGDPDPWGLGADNQSPAPEPQWGSSNPWEAHIAKQTDWNTVSHPRKGATGVYRSSGTNAWAKKPNVQAWGQRPDPRQGTNNTRMGRHRGWGEPPGPVSREVGTNVDHW